MSEQKTNKPPIPRWAWFFAGACFIIPVVTLGGAIPGAIGGGAGFAVIAIARQIEKPLRARMIQCGVVTGSAWTVFVVFLLAMAALQAKHPQLEPAGNRLLREATSKNTVESSVATAPAAIDPDVLDEDKKRKIYLMATRTRSHIKFARDNNSSYEHIKRLEDMHESRMDFTARFYKITRTQVDDIVAEGDFNNWPTD